MIFTNTKMFDSVPVLAQAKDEKGLLGYAIAVNLRKLGNEVAVYSQKRDELLAQHGTPHPDHPGQYNLGPAEAAAFYEAMQPLDQIETEVAVMQVPAEVFYSGTLTSGQMYALDWMVKEE